MQTLYYILQRMKNTFSSHSSSLFHTVYQSSSRTAQSTQNDTAAAPSTIIPHEMRAICHHDYVITAPLVQTLAQVRTPALYLWLR